MTGRDFNKAAKAPFLPDRPDINEGIGVLESRGFVFKRAEINPNRVSNIEFGEPGTFRVAVITYSESGGPFPEPLVLIGVPNTIDPEIVVSLKEFIAAQGAQAAPKTAPEGPKP